MRISDWSSDVCSSDLLRVAQRHRQHVVEVVVVPVHLRERQRRTRGILPAAVPRVANELDRLRRALATLEVRSLIEVHRAVDPQQRLTVPDPEQTAAPDREPIGDRSEEHTSELQSLMRISY